MSTSAERGYTLVELAVVMGIFLILMSMATPFMFNQLRSALVTESRVDVQQDARSILRTVVGELRQARELYATAEKPTGRNAVSFGVDLNSDGVINAYTDASKPLEQITYYVSGSTLFRARRQGQGQPLAEGVSGLVFSIFGSNLALDRNGDGIVTEDELDTNANGVWETSELANVTRIRVSVTVADNSEQQTYGAEAFLRNRTAG